MSNMGYCRFQNTLPDLQDCYDHMDNLDHEDFASDEARARSKIIKLAKRIIDDYGWEIEGESP